MEDGSGDSHLPRLLRSPSHQDGEEDICSPLFLPVTKLELTIWKLHCTFHLTACEDRTVIIRVFINNNVAFSSLASD